jgi:intein-encoded DNA endonuclease-like protein
MITKEKEESVIYHYSKGLSTKKVADLSFCNVKTVRAILLRNNIKMRTLSEALMKYSCNDNFFSTIDSEIKAYWLGALYADGNISKKASKSGQIFLTSSDEEWVLDFMQAIVSTNKPRKEFHKKYNTFVWKAQITSSVMFDNLNDLGCIPAKSKTITFPKIHDDLVHHFIRGYFDGDGTVGQYKNSKTKDWHVLKSGICSGSELFIKQILEKIPVKNKNIYYKGVYTTQFSVNDSIALYNYIYKNANVYLVRKKQIFDKYILNYKPRKRFRDYNGLPK